MRAKIPDSIVTDPKKSNETVLTVDPVSRRTFISGVAAAALAAFIPNAVDVTAEPIEDSFAEDSSVLQWDTVRRTKVKNARTASLTSALKPRITHKNNGEEKLHSYIANFSKALPKLEFAEPSGSAYKRMLSAIASGRPSLFERITLGGTDRLQNPLAAYAVDLQGSDSHAIIVPPAPRLDSAENSAEMAEAYWMASLRDISFADFTSNTTVQTACNELANFTRYRSPKINLTVTPATVFRGNKQDLNGPMVSQLLFRSPMTTSNSNASSIDYLTDERSFLLSQNGFSVSTPVEDPVVPYIRNGRDLARYVHHLSVADPFYQAALYLFHVAKVPLDTGNPYVNSYSKIAGDGTLGLSQLLSNIWAVVPKAIYAASFQQWGVHRRLTPEEFGARIHYKLTANRPYRINAEILNSQIIQETFIKNNGSYFLPQCYPEGAPANPSYPNVQATIAGACATILKAWFDENTAWSNPVIASTDGQTVQAYDADDAEALTVEHEINKLSFNIAYGRQWAGVALRSDSEQGLRLGEKVATSFLASQALSLREQFYFTFHSFEGLSFRITGTGRH